MKIKKTIKIFIFLIIVCVGIIGFYYGKNIFNKVEITTLEQAIQYSKEKNIELETLKNLAP